MTSIFPASFKTRGGHLQGGLPKNSTDSHKFLSFNLLYDTSFTLFILLSVIVACLCLYDVVRQTLDKVKSESIQDTTIAISSCVLVALISLIISISRYFTVNYMLSTIPKAYVPITADDLPHSIYQIINQEYGRVAIISWLSANSIRCLNRQRPGLEGWGKPGSVYEGKRFSDLVLEGVKVLEQALDDFLITHPTPPIPTQSSSLNPLSRVSSILSPTSATQPTPILLNSAQRQIFKRYSSILSKALTPSQTVTELDYEMTCKCLMILVQQINQCRSEEWENPAGYGKKNDPIYQGVRFKDAIIETAVKLEQFLDQTLGHLIIPKSARLSIGHSSSNDPIENLHKKFFPLIYPPFLPIGFGTIIKGYDELLKEMIEKPDLERTQIEYEFALRCFGSLTNEIKKIKKS
ncbi:hypothetical protein O181_030314 [Austropuccinia psidii MF-1]|uniref:Defect at low temperature protein 1 n=1 Tax=Austropuccinia psidii MF-1 TaxID=1389203 RepID=A0A9Q3H5G2_9BASI|nr:hypothetical protein [Austropuccinia psidii MF-1]